MADKAQMKVGGRQLQVSNLDKVLYPAAGFTKGDVMVYYARVARFLLPHFKDRPVTLKRYPDGIRGEFFYEKQAPGFTPHWVETFPVPRRAGGPPIRYILINDPATLAWTANLASLELHPFLHCVPKIQIPTHLVFDLDPGEDVDILACCEVALMLRSLLNRYHLEAFPKVSGSKGLQVYVPLNRTARYEVTLQFARTFAQLLARQRPDLVIPEMSKTARRGRVFIDWSQNSDHKTTVGPYSLRAKHERPYVSMPVTWNELVRARRQGDADALFFEPDAALTRLKKVGDLFAPVLRLKQQLPSELPLDLPPAHPRPRPKLDASAAPEATTNIPSRSKKKRTPYPTNPD